MTSDEKVGLLATVIEKARERGWDDEQLRVHFPKEQVQKYGVQVMQAALAESPQSIIFRHDFAKAFFGASWQRHLSAMVLQEEPLKYLEDFV